MFDRTVCLYLVKRMFQEQRCKKLGTPGSNFTKKKNRLESPNSSQVNCPQREYSSVPSDLFSSTELYNCSKGLFKKKCWAGNISGQLFPKSPQPWIMFWLCCANGSLPRGLFHSASCKAKVSMSPPCLLQAELAHQLAGGWEAEAVTLQRTGTETRNVAPKIEQPPVFIVLLNVDSVTCQLSI